MIVEAGKPIAGVVRLQAKWTENNTLVRDAKITGKIAGQIDGIEFFDDGKHSDAAANDGIYGANIAKLPAGDYFVEAKAEADNQIKFAVVQITVGAGATAKPTARRKGK